MTNVQPMTLHVLGRPGRVHAGGSGETVVLIHGAWGGAAVHWDRVWGRLAERFRVLAPDLPGIGDLSQPGLGGLGDYARWTEAVLDACAVQEAVLVGNALGAAVAWDTAARIGSRCHAVVLVNGTALPRTSPVMRTLSRWPRSRGLVRRLHRGRVFGARTRRRAFASPERVPLPLRFVFDHADPPQLDAVLDVLERGGEGEPPAARTFLVFGERDRFPGSTPRVARRQLRAMPGAGHAFVPAAGHLPQLENPDAFLGALVPFLDAASPGSGR